MRPIEEIEREYVEAMNRLALVNNSPGTVLLISTRLRDLREELDQAREEANRGEKR